MEDMVTYLDGVACTRFKATLLHREITPVKITNYDEWIEGAINPMELKESTFSYSKITLKYFIEGENEKETLLNISNLVKAHIKAVLKFSDLNLKYNTKIESHTAKQIHNQYYELTIVLKSDFKLDQDKHVIINPTNHNKEVICTSNVDTPVKLTIFSSMDETDVEIKINNNSIKIPSIKIMDVIVIDSINYSITLNGITKIDAAELWTFPFLKSGVNNITVNKRLIYLYIEYTERFI